MILLLVLILLIHIVTSNCIIDNWNNFKIKDDEYKEIAYYPVVNVVFLIIMTCIVILVDWYKLHNEITKESQEDENNRSVN